MNKIIQKIVARILKSSLFMQNPFIDFTRIENDKKIAFYSKNVSLDFDSKLLDEAIVHDFQNNNNNKIKTGNESIIRGELLVFKFGGCIEIGVNSFIGKDTKILKYKNI